MPRLVHNGIPIDWTFLRHARSKRMTLTVRHDGEVRVTAPVRRGSEREAEKLVKDHAVWIIRALDRLGERPEIVPLQGSRDEYNHFKKAALAVVRERLERYASVYGVRPGRISIRNQKSRWGSCSRQGNLSFHYKIALVPRPLADYLVVHELCHMRSFDHSPRFWQLVVQTIPDYKRMRKLLTKFGGEEEPACR